MEEKNKMDRRVRRTKTLLIDALANLISEKSIKDITVKELCSAADINRGTFYLHYKDIYNMIEQTEQDILNRFSDLIARHQPDKLRADPYPLLYDIFEFTAENAELYKILLCPNGDISFLAQIKVMFRERCLNLWSLNPAVTDPAQFEYTYSFIAAGCIGLIESWLFADQPESPEEMAALASNIITAGIQSFLP